MEVAARCCRSALAGLGPVQEPADLPLRIRVAISQERARSRRSIFTCWIWPGKTLWGRSCCRRARALPVRCCCWAPSFFWFRCLPSRRRRRLRPTSRWAMPLHRVCSITPMRPAAIETGAINGPVVVEAYINDAGEVYDYRIVSGPTDAATRSQVENLLLFSRFAPARFFGQPVRGLAVLSFSGVSVRG